MALFNIQYRSAALDKNTPIVVVIPEAAPAEDIPTLYLLHGMHGNHADWTRKSSIERYAQDRGIAVVMPDGENSFYHDMVFGEKYFTYVADELVAYTRKIFRLSHKREKTFIAGLSMGGYGAFRLALMRPHQYAAAASLSGCVDMATRIMNTIWDDRVTLAQSIWGLDYKNAVHDSDSDLFYLIKNWPADAPRPRLYSACGTEDSLYEDNIVFRDFMAEHPEFEYSFTSAPGKHNFAFWDTWICPAMDYMLGEHIK
ncbi:MAG: prolyl oligopeptidase family serine peptidase [Clostridia bacterium]|nr:prolyl oligopeptidase family serine peptidase [Clostridia bacterium]